MSEKLKILVVDDEAPARSRLKRLLARDPRAGAVSEAEDGPAAVAAIDAGGIDLVLLDIQMPGMTGFEVIEAVGTDAMPSVVFVTAYDEHALDAFEVQALDYLLKPVSAARLGEALDRAQEKRRGGDRLQEKLVALLEGLGEREEPLRRLVVPEKNRLTVVPVDRIRFLRAAGNYVEVHGPGKPRLWRGTLTSLEGRLDPHRFVRIHRSTIVNLDAVQALEPWSHGDYEVVLDDGERLRLSRRYRDRLLPDDD